MKINIIKSFNEAHKAEGLTVVIDVLRAFTTACFVLHRGAEKIICVADLELAYKLKQENPDYILIGERGGLKLPGFDFGNSPAEIFDKKFNNKTAILTTSAGTQGIVKATNAEEIITGAFVNAAAIVKYIKKKKPNAISFICTDDRYLDNEDFMLVKYIISSLENKPFIFADIKKYLMNHPTSVGFLRKPLNEYSKKDFHLSLSLDTFDFLIKAKRENELIYLERS